MTLGEKEGTMPGEMRRHFDELGVLVLSILFGGEMGAILFALMKGVPDA